MISQEIRRRFLQYFKEKGHAIIPSSSVVPHDDPTLLFNNAGMNQFKDVFLGKSERDYKRAATAQKCIRVGGKHNDLDNVGHTSRHLTFFEMLGNFSFGNYFKEKAIEYAFEVTTQIFKFPLDRLWITVFKDDDEAFSLWQKWMPKERILRFGEKDNFWAMGDTGPCGPCSELYLDRGEKYGTARSPQDDATGERYLEFWNLVFMQYNRDATGKLSTLPNQSIDTGAGLERVISLIMDVDTLFATDILRSLIAGVEQISGKKYDPKDAVYAPAFHVIADHIRSLAFAIADGAQPSNVERGYVLRKLLRRAVRYGRGLGMQEPFLANMLPRLVEIMGGDYPELISSKSRIAEILTLEEESFIRTLKKGGNILNQIIEKAQKSALKQISGEEAFKLKDTYGFPVEEILLIAKDTGLQVNLEAFQLLEEQAKEKSRSTQITHVQEAATSLFKEYLEKHGPCEFLGYFQEEAEGTIRAIVQEGEFVETLSEGIEAILILDKTPFYAEKGGQVADIGNLTHEKAYFSVKDCQNPYPDVIIHIGKLDKGSLSVGESVLARIDVPRRKQIENHHTATHLVHWALQQVLGDHIRQAGSLVEPNRLRFDFNHHKPLSLEEIRHVENLVNEKIRENTTVNAYELPYEEVQKRADIKQFFGEKYSSRVRVIDIDFSKELCGGTHAHHLGTLGILRITKEGSIAAGVRRIEASVGKAALEFIYQNEDLALAAAQLLKTPLTQLPDRVSLLLESQKELSLELKNLKRSSLKQMAEKLSKQIIHIGSIPLLMQMVDLESEDLPLLADDMMNAAKSLVLILATAQQDRCQLFVKVSPNLVQKGVHAGSLIKEISDTIGGAGGGKAESAQAGGKHPQGIPSAFEKARKAIENLSH